jgi:hypothetical protein
MTTKDKEEKNNIEGRFLNEIDKINFISKSLDALSFETNDNAVKEVRPTFNDMKGASDILREVGENLSEIHGEIDFQ